MEKFEQTRHIHLIMELGGEKNLKDYLKARKNNWPNITGRSLSPEIKRLFKKIVEGVKYLHDQNIVHRDLKLMNIVLADLDSPKIVDFGFARQGLDSNFENGCGTPSYMAPELLGSATNKRACKADVWALGVILFYLLTKNYPFRCKLEVTSHQRQRLVPKNKARETLLRSSARQNGLAFVRGYSDQRTRQKTILPRNS